MQVSIYYIYLFCMKIQNGGTRQKEVRGYLHQSIKFSGHAKHLIRKNKTFSNINHMKEFIENFFTLMAVEIYGKGIEKLPDKWQKIFPKNGEYINK